MPDLAMKGVVLAAGKGSRLYPVTHHIPKPLLPLANRITLEYAFDRLKEIGVHEICVVVGENEPAMRRQLGTGAEFGVNLEYVRQTDPHGLAHAVSFAKDFVSGDPFVLYLGDAVYSQGFEKQAQRFRDSGCANLNLVKAVPDPSRFGVANVDGERIVKLVEKPRQPESNLAMAGLYFFGPQLWSVLPDLQPSARGEYEITDAIQIMIDRGEIVLASEYEGEWFDTGTLSSFLETSAFLTGGAQRIAADAEIEAEMVGHVVIGEGVSVRAVRIENAVILPGSKVTVRGSITGCLIGGEVQSDTSLVDEIRFG